MTAFQDVMYPYSSLGDYYEPPTPPRSADQMTQTHFFDCQLCDSRLTSKAALCYHERVHTVVYECIWAECSNRFTSRRDYKKHMDAHTSERFLPCSWCSKSFDNQERYQVHVREHTEKPFLPCEQCPAKFDQKVKLRHHERMHTSAKFVHLYTNPATKEIVADSIKNVKKNLKRSATLLLRKLKSLDSSESETDSDQNEMVEPEQSEVQSNDEQNEVISEQVESQSQSDVSDPVPRFADISKRISILSRKRKLPANNSSAVKKRVVTFTPEIQNSPPHGNESPKSAHDAARKIVGSRKNTARKMNEPSKIVGSTGRKINSSGKNITREVTRRGPKTKVSIASTEQLNIESGSSAINSLPKKIAGGMSYRLPKCFDSAKESSTGTRPSEVISPFGKVNRGACNSPKSYLELSQIETFCMNVNKPVTRPIHSGNVSSTVTHRALKPSTDAAVVPNNDNSSRKNRQVESRKSVLKFFQCDKCNYSVHNIKQYDKHMLIHNRKKSARNSHQCTFCSAFFNCAAAWKGHVSHCH